MTTKTAAYEPDVVKFSIITFYGNCTPLAHSG